MHQDTTKTGKPKYYFSTKNDGNLADEIPAGFEIYENPNAQVFLRKKQPKLITDEEIKLVEEGIKQYSKLQDYRVEAKKNMIIVYKADQDINALSGIFRDSFFANEAKIGKVLSEVITYSPVLQFGLIDKEKRLFAVERFCYMSGIDDWIEIGNPDTLKNQVKKYLKHLGRDSYYELF